MNNPYSATNKNVSQHILFAGCDTDYISDINIPILFGGAIDSLVVSEKDVIRLSKQHLLDSAAAVVLGPRVTNPIQLCQLLGKCNRELPVIVIRTDMDIHAIAHRIRMFPGIGRRTSVLPVEKNKIVADQLVTFVQQYTAFVKHRHKLVLAQQQTAAIRYNPSPAEQYLNVLLEALPVGVAIVNETGKVESINSFGREVLDLDNSRNIKKFFYSFFSGKTRGEIKSLIQRCLLNNENEDGYPFCLKSKDKNQYYLLSCMPLNFDDGKKRLLNVIQDVSAYTISQMALKQSQLEFDQIVETIQEVFWVCSSDYKKLFYISPAFKNI